MNDVGRLVAAREDHRASRWVRACEGYADADRVTPLGIEDLDCWAEAAQIIGRVDEAIAVLARCFELRAEAGEIHEATRTAYWLWSVHVFTRGEFAIAAGWVERARGLAARAVGRVWLAADPAGLQEHRGGRLRDCRGAAASGDRAGPGSWRRRPGHHRDHDVRPDDAQAGVDGERVGPARRGDGPSPDPDDVATGNQRHVLRRDRLLLRGARDRARHGVVRRPRHVALRTAPARRRLLRELPDLPCDPDAPARGLVTGSRRARAGVP